MFRYILRQAGRRSGTPAQLLPAPITRIPLWVVHNERGDISGSLKDLAAALPLPCYGLAMGADAEQCGSLEALAAQYVQSMQAVQPVGPYLVLGPSLAGSALAHAMAGALQAAGEAVALVVLDGCVGAPGAPVHDATWYALFYLLREVGSFRGSMGELVDFVRSATSPAQQLKLLNSFKPRDCVSDEQWDAAVYTTLDRATALKRLMRGAHGGSGPSSSSSGAVAGGFTGPSALLAPSDRIGQQLLEASRRHLGDGSAAAADMTVLGLEARHTECVLEERARQATALRVVDAVRLLLRRLT